MTMTQLVASAKGAHQKQNMKSDFPVEVFQFDENFNKCLSIFFKLGHIIKVDCWETFLNSNNGFPSPSNVLVIRFMIRLKYSPK